MATVLAVADGCCRGQRRAARSLGVQAVWHAALSVANPIKPLTYSLGLAIGLVFTAPAVEARAGVPLVFRLLCRCRRPHVVVQPGSGAHADGEAVHVSRPLRAADVLPGVQLAARAGAVLDDDHAVPRGARRDVVRSPGVPPRRYGTRRLAATVLVSLAVLADGWVTDLPLCRAPETWAVESCGVSTGNRERRGVDRIAAWRSLSRCGGHVSRHVHGRPLVNGYSGYFPPHYAALRFGLGVRDEDVLAQLASHGVTDVVVDSARDGDGAWAAIRHGAPGNANDLCRGRADALSLGRSNADAAFLRGWQRPFGGASAHCGAPRQCERR